MSGTPDLLERIAAVTVWKRGDERAPHKPLLLLYALGRCSQGLGPDIPYEDVDRDLGALLRNFGPFRKSVHPEYPFWRLQRDDLWDVRSPRKLTTRKSNSDPLKSELMEGDVTGRLLDEDYQLLRAQPELLRAAAREILERNFPDSVHDDIMAAVGLQFGSDASKSVGDSTLGDTTSDVKPGSDRVVSTRRRRDPRFRNRVLTAYECRCAVCGVGLRLGDVLVGVEAAHIKWHQAGGPDSEPNGLALCSLHHKLFDRGAFTISEERDVWVSERAHGETGMEDWLLRHHRQAIRDPVRVEYLPDSGFLAWHRKQVFLGRARA